MQITHKTVCNADNCPMSSQCSLHQQYIAAIKTEPCIPLLNTSLLTITENGCKHLHIPQTVIAARGFRKMYDTIPKKNATNLWKCYPEDISRRQFYRLLSGEVLLMPDTQEMIISFLQEKGADTSIGFDSYEKATI